MSKGEAKEPKTVAPKGTKVTEVILGTAAAKMASGTKLLFEMVGELGKLQTQVDSNVLLIADQESKIAENALNLRNSIAQNRIELAQEYASDREKFVNSWLEEHGYEKIEKEELVELKATAEAAEKNAEAEIKKQTAIISSTLDRQRVAELKEKDLEFKAKEAENNAKIGLMEEKITFLTGQVTKWEEQANEARKATVAVAQASTVQQTFGGSMK